MVKALALHTGDLSSIPGLGGIFFPFFPFFFCCRWGTLLGSRDSTVMGGGQKGKNYIGGKKKGTKHYRGEGTNRENTPQEMERNKRIKLGGEGRKKKRKNYTRGGE